MTKFQFHESVDLDSMKFLALERFMARLEAGPASPGHSEDAVEELQYSFLERCDALLLKSLSRLVVEEMEESVWEVTSESTWSLRLGQDDRPAEMVVLLRDCLDLLEQMEDVPESWMSLVLFDVAHLKSLYKEVEAVVTSCGPKSPECDATLILRDHLRELLPCSPLLTGEDRLRFRLVLLHLTPEGVAMFLRRFLMLHLEYGRELQARCWKTHPEWAPRIQSVLMREAVRYAKKAL